jgi:hypothetical protein
MIVIRITNNGAMLGNDERGLSKRILQVILEEPKTLSRIVTEVRSRWHEYKHLPIKTYVEKIVSLNREGLIVYEEY